MLPQAIFSMNGAEKDKTPDDESGIESPTQKKTLDIDKEYYR
jgi:hypothetical protein